MVLLTNSLFIYIIRESSLNSEKEVPPVNCILHTSMQADIRLHNQRMMWHNTHKYDDREYSLPSMTARKMGL